MSIETAALLKLLSPEQKTEIAGELTERIKKDISSMDVFEFMDFGSIRFSDEQHAAIATGMVKPLLKQLTASLKKVDFNEDYMYDILNSLELKAIGLFLSDKLKDGLGVK